MDEQRPGNADNGSESSEPTRSSREAAQGPLDTADASSLLEHAVRPAVGDVIDDYRLVDELEPGGMGVVFRAKQRRLGRPVAVKFIKPGRASPQVLARFEAERRTLARLNHPNIATVFDAGLAHGLPYFVMEWVPGERLTAFCDQRRLTLRERLALFADVCRGVHHAHTKGIIHRDLKPSNILVEEHDGERRVKIIDFGIARATDDRETLTELTLDLKEGRRPPVLDPTQLAGTPPYMSPEQFEAGEPQIDTRTDIYSLGVVLYELLTGTLPFPPREYADLMELCRAIREQTAERPSERVGSAGGDVAQARGVERAAVLSRSLAGDVDCIVTMAMQRRAADRYDAASELTRDLERYLDGLPVAAAGSSTAYRVGKLVRRHRVGVALAASLLFALVAGATVATWQAVRATRAERAARFEADTANEAIDLLAEVFEQSDPERQLGRELTAKAVLDAGTARLEERLTDRPRVLGRLEATLGQVHRSLGHHTDSERLLARAVESHVAAYGENHLETASALNLLAGTQIKIATDSSLDAAEQHSRRALAILETLQPAEANLLWARTYNNLGGIEHRRQNYEAAIAHYTESVRRRELAEGPRSAELIGPLGNIGSALNRLKRFDEALEYHERALELARLDLDPKSPRLARLMNNAGTAYRGVDQNGRAIEYLEGALAIRDKVLDNDHPELFSTLLNLSLAYRGANRYADAIPLLERYVADGPSVLGERSRGVLASWQMLGEVHDKLGHPDEARRARRRLQELAGTDG